MTNGDTQPRWGDGVVVSQPRLYRLDFLWGQEGSPDHARAKTEFHLGLHRSSPYTLGIEFGVSVVDVPGLTARAIYRMECTLEEGSPEWENAETAFRSIAARLAPTVMYPYVRETLATTAQKSGIAGLVLPVVNFGNLYDPGEIDLPPAPAPEADAEPTAETRTTPR